MLLSAEEKTRLAEEIIQKCRTLISAYGQKIRDPETGFMHWECRIDRFILMEHQRQAVRGGKVKTSGLDVWLVHAKGARKVMSVRYLPFELKVFSQYNKGRWIQNLLGLDPQSAQTADLSHQLSDEDL